MLNTITAPMVMIPAKNAIDNIILPPLHDRFVTSVYQARKYTSIPAAVRLPVITNEINIVCPPFI